MQCEKRRKGLLPVNGSEEEENVEGVETDDGPARHCLLRGVEQKPRGGQSEDN